MSYFTSFTFLFFSILISKYVVDEVLRSKVEKDILNLIGSIIVLPAIPVFWRWAAELSLQRQEPNVFFSFYTPMFLTIFLFSMLLINIVKYNKNRSRGELEEANKKGADS